MKLIPFNAIIKIMQSEIDRLRWSSTLENIVERFNEIPSIDPIATIDEMIEDLLGKWGSIPEIAKNTHQVEVLQALKSRLSLIK